MPNYIAIMAGGIGSRFWPASREAQPKQFLDILGTGKSLLRLTFERFLPICPAERIYIVTNERYRAQIKEHLPELTDQQILGEPSRNNTAPCVAWIANKLYALDQDANFVIAPSDALILQEEQFRTSIQQALAFTAKNDVLLTLGIQPSRPDTGYGYIHFEPGEEDIRPVKRFTEKPPLEKAEAYLASGDYLWNAGIFIWRAAVVLDAFQQYAPEIARILGAGAEKYNTEAEQAFIDTAYPTTPSISVDYAIMEHADNIYTLPSSFGWSDLGTWGSLHAQAPKDADNNFAAGGPTQLMDTSDCLIRLPKDKAALIRGLQNFIVVDEGDVLMIYPKDQEQSIKQARKALQENWPETLF